MTSGYHLKSLSLSFSISSGASLWNERVLEHVATLFRVYLLVDTNDLVVHPARVSRVVQLPVLAVGTSQVGSLSVLC